MSESALSRPFDRILPRCPCSGLGVRRHPDGKWRKTPTTLRSIDCCSGVAAETSLTSLETGLV